MSCYFPLERQGTHVATVKKYRQVWIGVTYAMPHVTNQDLLANDLTSLQFQPLPGMDSQTSQPGITWSALMR